VVESDGGSGSGYNRERAAMGKGTPVFLYGLVSAERTNRIAAAE
jgi:hypothetical protein